MKNDRKCFNLIFALLIVCVSAVLACLIGILWRTEYAKTEIANSSHGQYRMVIYMIGEPDWPYGATHCRADLYEKRKKISSRSFDVKNDGAIVSAENFDITWSDDGVTLTVYGSEQFPSRLRFGLTS